VPVVRWGLPSLQALPDRERQREREREPPPPLLLREEHRMPRGAGGRGMAGSPLSVVDGSGYNLKPSQRRQLEAERRREVRPLRYTHSTKAGATDLEQ
jgi:hypothetical protein